MIIPREIASKLQKLCQYFPVVCVTGPRQSGKTTLIRMLFPDKPYISFEDPDTLLAYTNDPRGFLNTFKDGALLDEAQNVPSLFSYLQGIVDAPEFNGNFILSGSQNFLLLEKITQSLAGRVGIVNVFPFSIAELDHVVKYTKNKFILNGFYPRLYNKKIPPNLFYPGYIQTYIERDIAGIKSITDKTAFFRFLKLCAARCSQILNYSQLATDCGIAVNTAKAWLSLLESSYIIFLLQPFYTNISKRLIKSPKLYFYDTGLTCYLLDIRDEKQVSSHFSSGYLFENFIVADLYKQLSYKYDGFSCYYLRDKTGHEIDFVLSLENIKYIEIKSSETWHTEYNKNLHYFNKIIPADKLFLIYSGNMETSVEDVQLLNWKNLSKIFASD